MSRVQSITALAHLRAAVLYVIDISEQCGFTIKQQVGACLLALVGSSLFGCQRYCDRGAERGELTKQARSLLCSRRPGTCAWAHTPACPAMPSIPDVSIFKIRLHLQLNLQATLFHSIKPLFANKPVLIVANKTDVVKLEQLSGGQLGCLGVCVCRNGPSVLLVGTTRARCVGRRGQAGAAAG